MKVNKAKATVVLMQIKQHQAEKFITITILQLEFEVNYCPLLKDERCGGTFCHAFHMIEHQLHQVRKKANTAKKGQTIRLNYHI